MNTYRTELFAQEAREQRKQDKMSTRLNKVFTGTLKPSDAEIIKEQRRKANEMYTRSVSSRI